MQLDVVQELAVDSPGRRSAGRRPLHRSSHFFIYGKLGHTCFLLISGVFWGGTIPLFFTRCTLAILWR